MKRFLRRKKDEKTALDDDEKVQEPNELPAEKDRKALLGCWVTILASSNAHYTQIFTTTGGDDEEEDTGTKQAKVNSSKKQKQVQLELDQHLKRRYKFHCDLLVEAGKSLDLDDDHAAALLPLLEHLAKPSAVAEDKLQLDDSTHHGGATDNERKYSVTPLLSEETSGDKKAGTPKTGGDNERKYSVTPLLSKDMPADNNDTEEAKAEAAALEEELQKKDTAAPNLSHETEALDRIRNAMEASKPFVEELTPGSDFRCVAILLMKSILKASSGYDARYRSDLKRLAIILFLQSKQGNVTLEQVQQASDLFHTLENSIGSKLLLLALVQKAQKRGADEKTRMSRKDHVIRGLKVGSAGVVAGTLLAVTGGMAAPAIAAGVAGVVGTSLAASAVVISLTSTAAITTIFGVGGGAYVARKMQRRTAGLTEFEFHKEFEHVEGGEDDAEKIQRQVHDAELFSTIAISGWIRDQCDFQRPWGLQPSTPAISSKRELLERFYTVHNPDRVGDCEQIAREWKGHEDDLWAHLKQKYGCSPDHPFSKRSPKPRLSLEQDEIIQNMCVQFELCKTTDVFAAQQAVDAKQDSNSRSTQEDTIKPLLQDSLHGPKKGLVSAHNIAASVSTSISRRKSSTTKSEELAAQNADEDEGAMPKHTKTVWDYRSEYYGELYTVRFEGELLKQFCDSVRTMVADVAVKQAGTTALKYTVLAALVTAVVLPASILKVADMIDGKWSMVMERADAAGIELAKTLMDNKDAGQRPVNLVGYAFGARIIFSCLRELARCQVEWEKQMKSKGKSEFSREPAGIVEDVVLIGLPRNITSSFQIIRQVVAGRFVNCYSTKDWFLLLMYQYKQATRLRLSNVTRAVAGASPIDVPGIENIDISDLVHVQSDYCDEQVEILKRVRLGHPAY